MAAEYRVSALLDAMRDAGMLPESDESFTTARLLSVMNAEQRLYLSRLLLSAREEYQVAFADVALTPGATRYRVPSRAVGAKLKMVSVVDGSGNVRPLQPATPERTLTHGGAGYYLEGNEVVLTDASLSGSLRLAYFRRLSTLVEADAVATITSIDSASRTVVVGSVPSGMNRSATQRYDVVQAKPHFDALAVDQPVVFAGTSLTFSEALPSGLAVGDYVCLTGETPVCQAPLELHNVLVQRAVVKVLEAKGDPKAAAAAADLAQMREDALALITPRVEATPYALVNHYAPGWGRYPSKRRR